MTTSTRTTNREGSAMTTAAASYHGDPTAGFPSKHLPPVEVRDLPSPLGPDAPLRVTLVSDSSRVSAEKRHSHGTGH